MNYTLRTTRPDEETLIFSFLYLAARMPEEKEPIQKALTDLFLKKYWINWGRKDDFGVVAVDFSSGIPISCSWVRLFTKEEAGSGFVYNNIPELATATVEGFRNMGLGKATLEYLIAKLQNHHPGVCLSVREDNPAVRLYEKIGFKKVVGSEMKNRVGTKSFNMLLKF